MLHTFWIQLSPVSNYTFLVSVWDLVRMALNTHVSTNSPFAAIQDFSSMHPKARPASLPITQSESHFHIFDTCYSSTPLLGAKIFLSLGWHNRIPQTGLLKQQKFASHSSGSWTPRSRCQRTWRLVKPSSWLEHSPSYSHVLTPEHTERERERELWSHFFKVTNSVGSGPHPYDLT